MNENGEIDQGDVIEFFENQHRDEWGEPQYWDFTGNGGVGHGDVIWVFECVALD